MLRRIFPADPTKVVEVPQASVMNHWHEGWVIGHADDPALFACLFGVGVRPLVAPLAQRSKIRQPVPSYAPALPVVDLGRPSH